MTQEIKAMYELVRRLMEADPAYYKHDAPIMTDREYDRLHDELLAAERSTGIVLSGSPTQKVSGEILELLEQVEHTKSMLSAKKTKFKEEIAAFIGGRPGGRHVEAGRSCDTFLTEKVRNTRSSLWRIDNPRSGMIG